MEITNKEFSSHFSDAFTPEIKAFAKETLLKEGFDCLIVTDREDKEKAYCTHCKKMVKIPGNSLHSGSPRTAWRRERDSHYCTAAYLNIPEEEMQRRKAIKARKEMTCPSCGCTLAVYHQWRMYMGQLDGTASISIWAKSKTEPDAVVMRRIEIDRSFGNDAGSVVEDTFTEAERYLFRMGHKTVRQNCHYLENKYKNGKWTSRYIKKFVKSIGDRAARQSNVMWHDYINGHYRMDIGSLLKAIQDTPYQYLFDGGERNYLNHYDRYKFRTDYPFYTVPYMDLYSLHPWIELLIKNGMDNLVMDHIRGDGCRGGICWSARSIKSAVKRFTKQDMKDVMEYNSKQVSGSDHVSEYVLAFLAEAREKIFQKITLTQCIEFAKEGMGVLDSLKKVSIDRKLNIEKCIAYCRKQSRSKYHQLGDWVDYLADAKKLGLDLTLERNLFPKDLHKMHANISRQIKYRHDKEIEEKLKSTLAMRSKMFYWKGKKYLIRLPESTEEIIAEGKALHHCVGGYAQRHAEGKTTILFVRENTNPDKPFVTMEMQHDGNKWMIVQMRGYMNNTANNPLPKEVIKMAARYLQIVNERTEEMKGKKVRIRVA